MDQAIDTKVQDAQSLLSAAHISEGPTESISGVYEGPELLRNRISELEQQLHSTDAQLKQCQGENTKKPKVTFIDALQNDDIHKLIEDYKAQTRKLKDELNRIPGNSDAKRLTDENERLKKCNCVLRTTNTRLTLEITTLKNLQQAENSQSFGSQHRCDPGGGIVGTSASSKTGKMETAADQNHPPIEQLLGHLNDYWQKCLRLLSETVQLKKQVQNCQKLITEQKEIITRLTEEQNKSQTHVSSPKLPFVDTESRVQKFKDLVVKLQSENKWVQAELLHRDNCIHEQKARIEKLTLKHAEVRKNHDAASHGHVGQEICEHLNSLVEKNEEIKRLNEIIKDYEEQLGKSKVEIEELKNQDASIAFKEQLKTFQDDWFAEREEKQQIIKRSKQLQVQNENLIFELHHYSHQYSSPLSESNSSLESMSPPMHCGGSTPRQLSFSSAPGMRSLHAQAAVHNTGIPVHHVTYSPASFVHSNTIPTRPDYSGQQNYARSAGNQHGTYGHLPDQHWYHYRSVGAPAGYSSPACNTSLHGSWPRMPPATQQNYDQSQHRNGPS